MSNPPSQGVELQLAFSAVRRHTTLPYSPHHGPRYIVIVTVYPFSLKGKGLMEVTEWVVCPHHACAPPHYTVLSLVHGGGRALQWLLNEEVQPGLPVRRTMECHHCFDFISPRAVDGYPLTGRKVMARGCVSALCFCVLNELCHHCISSFSLCFFLKIGKSNLSPKIFKVSQLITSGRESDSVKTYLKFLLSMCLF